MARHKHGHMGAHTITVDALDRQAVLQTVEHYAPDAIINLLTAIPKRINPVRMAQDFSLTNTLRTVGTENLCYAARRNGNTRIISASIAFGYEPRGHGLATEKTAWWHDPPKPFEPVLAAIKRLESTTLATQGTVLRFGHLYGPGTTFAPDGWIIHDIQQGKLPLVGGGTATFSFTHTHDAAALHTPNTHGVFNIVDNQPVQVHQWLPGLAEILGAPKPKTVPAWLAGFAVGSWGVAFMTRLRGADNTKSTTQLGWQPFYPNWHTGFTHELEQQQGRDVQH